MTHHAFVLLVHEMRNRQRAYFKATRADPAQKVDLIRKSIEMEKQVDREIERFVQAAREVS